MVEFVVINRSRTKEDNLVNITLESKVEQLTGDTPTQVLFRSDDNTQLANVLRGVEFVQKGSDFGVLKKYCGHVEYDRERHVVTLYSEDNIPIQYLYFR